MPPHLPPVQRAQTSAAVALALLLLHPPSSVVVSSSSKSSTSPPPFPAVLPLPYPDVFMIGAQKCGTTSTAYLLLQHGAFCTKGLKEKHYFSDEKAFLTSYETHYDAYVKQFEGCNRTQLTMDATPSYVWYDFAPELLQRSYTRKELSKKKFILLLREPVQRSYSEYQRDLRICLRAYDSASRCGPCRRTAPLSSPLIHTHILHFPFIAAVTTSSTSTRSAPPRSSRRTRRSTAPR